MKKLSLLVLLLGSSYAFSQIKIKDPLPTHGIFQEKKERKAAEYPGGIGTLIKDISKEIKTGRIRGARSGQIRSNAKFIVGLDGKIAKVEVTGDNQDLNSEVERVLKSMKTKWIPGEQNGTPVETWYRVPVVVNFN
ncbi:energy transducer TonB [Chryseobacterium jejuense]|uniref:energy transducer TonB n=1 Tax=Chryseobacterium jejuense TaxID=445960 RepID=UPI001AE4B2C0|nr:hypothetical protein [Chryseobacterium jejuense]MBP2617372.1 hypothetical protein [Chryseobacterium jejuense]